MKVIIAASQTGGHINPGIAIANKIKEEEKDGIVRKISIDNFKKMLKTLKGYGEAKKILKEEKPDIVIGTGGFICGPVLLAAAKQKIPTMLHESNAFPGVTVKLLAKKVDTILIGFEDAKAKIHDAKNVVLTGTPTKFKEIQYSDKDKEEFLKENNLQKDKTLILVFGGSQGARPINNALEEIIGLMNISKEEVVTIGDNANDLKMITNAGLGVAMGESAPYVKQSADIIAPTNDEDGVAIILNKIFDLNL